MDPMSMNAGYLDKDTVKDIYSSFKQGIQRHYNKVVIGLSALLILPEIVSCVTLSPLEAKMNEINSLKNEMNDALVLSEESLATSREYLMKSKQAYYDASKNNDLGAVKLMGYYGRLSEEYADIAEEKMNLTHALADSIENELDRVDSVVDSVKAANP